MGGLRGSHKRECSPLASCHSVPCISHLLGHDYGTAQGAKLVVHLLQLILLVALCHYATTSLEPQLVVAAYKGAYGYGLVQRAVEPYEAYAATISATVVWLILRYKLHRPNLRGARQCAGWECVDESLYRVGVVVESAADT